MRRCIEGWPQLRLEPAVHEAEHVADLQFLADSDATAAKDAFFVVADNKGIAVIPGIMALLAGKMRSACPQFRRQCLEFTVKIANAGQAIRRVVGQQQFKNGSSRLQYFRGVGVYDHSRRDRLHACRRQCSHAVDFDDTETTRSFRGEIGEMAERGDMDAGLTSRFQYTRSRFCLYGDSVDRQFNQVHRAPPPGSYLQISA